ncbi:MAG: molecular chaperone TorD family protein [Planctomycetota bacterium]
MSNQAEMTFEDYEQLSSVYHLLSMLWLKEPDQQLLTALSADELKSVIESLGGNVPEEITSEIVEELAIDYCQILIGPQGQVSPIQSVWEQGELQSQASSSMREFFELLPGFEPQNSIPDHFGVQLQFMSELFHAAAEYEDHDLVTQNADEFYQMHLQWAAPFFAAVAEKANTHFYAGLANLTANFLNLAPGEQ